MPPYPGNSLATLLRDNKQGFLWHNATVPVNAAQGSLSHAFQLERNRSAYPWGVSFEVWFSGAPGAFEIDIVGANDDIGSPSPGRYVVLGNITVVNASNVGRWDMPSNMWPKFVAGFVKTLTNPVTVTLQVTR